LLAIGRVLHRAGLKWTVWELNPPLRWYVLGVIAAAAAAAGWAAALTSWRSHDLLLFALLTCFGALTVEVGRRTAEREPAGHMKEVYAAWLLPVAFLLPPVYGLAASMITVFLLQIRVRRTIVHRRVFSGSASGVTLAAASVTFHALPVTSARPVLWLLAAAGISALWMVASQALVITAVWLSDPLVSARRQLLTRDALTNDACELAAGTLIACAIIGFGLVVLVPAFPLVVVLQRVFRDAQLQGGARVDAQTGLLTAVTWRAEAEVQLALAQAQRNTPLAVGIIRLGLGPGAGLLAAASTIRSGLRSYDRLGRWREQEIIFVLPATRADEAQRIAGRLRASLARSPGTVGTAVDIGMATTAAPGKIDLNELLAVADEALDQARQAGPGQICLASATADDPAQAAPALEDVDGFRRALGAHLAAARERAGLTQTQLAVVISQYGRRYARSTIANAERGRGSLSAAFWAACDRALQTSGALSAQYAQIVSQQALQARTGNADADTSTTALLDGAAYLTGPACPGCGLLLQITAASPQPAQTP
jgi:GGDEF domain-containing protein